MSGETQAADGTAVQEDEFDAEFEAGFANAGKGTTETPAPADEKTPDQATPEITPEPPAATPAPQAGPKRVEIDEAELQALRQRADSAQETAAFQKKFDQAFGQIGSLKQAIDKLRTETPAGEKVEISETDFKDLSEAYPEIGKLTAQGLNKVLGKFKGTGGADPEAIDKMVTERVAAARSEINGQVTDAVLNGIVPRWRQQVNTPAFDAWLKGQQAEVQGLAESDDLGDAATMLRLYRRHIERPAATPAPTPAPNRGATRQRQIAAAVTTRGDGAAPAASPAEDDDFAAGFKSGKV
jgi:hypothetical protein